EDTLLVIAAMYLDLNHDGRNTRELRIAEMHATLPAPLVDFLLAPDPTWEAPLEGPLSPEPVPPDASVFDLRSLPATRPVADLAAVLAPTHDARRPGSNSFAVAGTLTGTARRCWRTTCTWRCACQTSGSALGCATPTPARRTASATWSG